MIKLAGGHKFFLIFLVFFNLIFSKNVLALQIYDFHTEELIKKINTEIISVNSYNKKLNFRIYKDDFPNAYVTEDNTIYLLSPIVRGRKGEYKKEILNYKKRGFTKIKVDGEYLNIEEFPNLNKKVKHDISVVVDRVILNSNLGNRLADSVETAVNLSNGLLIVEYENETLPKKFRKLDSITFSSKFSCPESGFTIEEIEPRLFSFNSPFGACEECEGIGHNLNVDPNLVVPDSKKSLQDGAIEPWAKSTSMYYAQTLSSLAKHYKFSLSDQWKKIPKKIQDVILYGSDEEEIKFSYDDGYESYNTKKTFEGVVNNLERRYL